VPTMKPIYLLTGRPGTGKTSLIKQAIADFKGRAGGFYTEEIRSGGTRLGFKLVTLDGGKAVLAHADFSQRFRVGKYGVDVDGFEKIGVATLIRAAQNSDLVVVDEIGRMELFSDRFREAVLEIMNGGKRVLGTIMLQPHPWADAIKQKPQVNLVTLTRNNYQQVREELQKWLSAITSAV